MYSLSRQDIRGTYANTTAEKHRPSAISLSPKQRAHWACRLALALVGLALAAAGSVSGRRGCREGCRGGAYLAPQLQLVLPHAAAGWLAFLRVSMDCNPAGQRCAVGAKRTGRETLTEYMVVGVKISLGAADGLDNVCFYTDLRFFDASP